MVSRCGGRVGIIEEQASQVAEKRSAHSAQLRLRRKSLSPNMTGTYQPNSSVYQNKVDATDGIGGGSLSMNWASMPVAVSRRMTLLTTMDAAINCHIALIAMSM